MKPFASLIAAAAVLVAASSAALAGDIALDEGYGVTRRVACPQR